MIRYILAVALGAGLSAGVGAAQDRGAFDRFQQAAAGNAPVVPDAPKMDHFVVCFTPGSDCTGLIVDKIRGAQSEVLVQAYALTSPSILDALAQASSNGVVVRVILDRLSAEGPDSAAPWLVKHGIQPLVDDQVAVAHNKVVVIDGHAVITGSFNFTRSAQTRNAENVLLIDGSPDLAGLYAANWQRRAAASRPFTP